MLLVAVSVAVSFTSFLFAASGGEVSGDVPSAESLLKRYLEGRSGASSWLMRGSIVTQIRAKDAKGNWESNQYERRLTHINDGDRDDVEFVQMPSADGATNIPHPAYGELRRRIISRDNAGRSVSYQVNGTTYTIASFSPTPDKNIFQHAKLQLWDGEAYDGLLGRDPENFAVHFLREGRATVRPQMEQIGNRSCYVIDAVSNYGRYMLWLDPGAGCVPLRAVVEKSGSDLLAGEPMDKTVWKTFRWEMKNVVVQERQGRILPIEFEVESHFEAEDGLVNLGSSHFRCNDFVPNPELDSLNAFEIDAPVGTLFRLAEMPQFVYRWSGSEFIAAVDEGALAQIDALTSVPAEAHQVATASKLSTLGGTSPANKLTTTAEPTQYRLWRLSLIVVGVVALAGIAMRRILQSFAKQP